MKYISKIGGICLVAITLAFSSCESYLDKAPESIISEEDAFKSFMNFQGFIEEIYAKVPEVLKISWNTSFNFGEDEIGNISSNANGQLFNSIDQGNFWSWQTCNNSWIHGGLEPSLWNNSWKYIRKANVGIENFDILVDATQEEKDLILGQLYFFRAWWHYEIGILFGGFPYIDEVLPSDIPRYPRLPFRDYMDKVAADFEKAAELLPIDWDNTTVGLATLGKNSSRVNKITALAYLGKAHLWNASPLIEVGPVNLDGSDTYKYNSEYAKKAAEAFGELLALVENGETQYSLAAFDYENIYDHIKSDTAIDSYTQIFYTVEDNFKTPGASEAIFKSTCKNPHNSVWRHGFYWGPKVNALVDHDNYIHHPTANYVNYYGMENGLPITDPSSGFDPTHPFKNRDPRFYHDIMFDGFKFVNGTIDAQGDKHLKYLNLSTGGWARSDSHGSRTGYFTQKLADHRINKFDRFGDWNYKYNALLPYVRLSDIYLMYAEACAVNGGANGKSTNFNKSAVEAVNTIRARVGAGDVGVNYLSNDNKFMDEIRRERAVELAFEALRFDDLRRWLLLTAYPYNVKTAHEFTRVESDSFFETNDPRDAEVSGLREVEILRRNFSARHYWLPLFKDDVLLYEEFTQNPGW